MFDRSLIKDCNAVEVITDEHIELICIVFIFGLATSDIILGYLMWKPGQYHLVVAVMDQK